MNRTARWVVVLLVALAAAGAASFGVFQILRQMPVREVEVKSVEVVVASRHIPVGTLITNDVVKAVPWPARAPVAGGFTSIEAVVNRGAVVALAENEPITESKLAPVGAGAGLPPTIPEGMRAISVRTNEVIGVAGFVVPGTRVDVLVTVRRQGPQGQESMSRVVLSNVQVLTAGTRFDQETSQNDGKPIQTSVVTLLVTPEDAEKLALASEEGQIMLTLRNPLDVQPTETSGVRMGGLMRDPSPPPLEKKVEGRRVMASVRPPEPPPAPKPYTVETIRAAKRTEEPIK
jgi:pilus assembly protein CpaB